MPIDAPGRAVETPLPDESMLLLARQRDIAVGEAPAQPSTARGRLPASTNGALPLWGLALSGGGIRSATFSLGVLQAIAEAQRPAPPASAAPPPSGNDAVPAPGTLFRQSLLSRFDYLSTVSGGGYVGAFLCSLFVPRRLRADAGTPWQAADDAVRVLQSGPPGRIRAGYGFAGDALYAAPLAWLRENGRYLVPTGMGDAVYAGALAVRNWLALHYVIGTALLLALSMVALVRGAAVRFVGAGWEQAALAHAVAGHGPLGWLWWSPFFAAAGLLLAAVAVPVGVGFWMSYPVEGGTSRPLNRVVACTWLVALLALALVAASIAPWAWGTTWPFLDAPAVAALHGPRQLAGLYAAYAAVAGTLVYVAVALMHRTASDQRVTATRWLSACLLWVIGLAGLAVIDTLGQSLYLLWSQPQSGVAALAAPGGLLAVLVWLARRAAALLPRLSGTRLLKIPLTTLGGIAGVAIFGLVAVLWSFALNWLQWSAMAPDAAGLAGHATLRDLAVLAALFAGLALLAGWFPAFINLSGLQSFYSARIVRAYLGASNGDRFKGSEEQLRQTLSVAEPLARDNLALDAFFEADDAAGGGVRLTTMAPLHIINVALNKTVDPAEQLVQRDRKGQPLAVLPFGFAVDGYGRRFAREPARDAIQQPLLLGQWVGTSGAAFSTGIGRETSLGMSLLMGMANVRLGLWWDSRFGHTAEPRAASGWLAKALSALLPTQACLSNELRARFFGMRRRWQYLSDGGHFENTALYELLRPERQLALVVASDNGADPGYAFGDLANLMRLVRIDFGVELSVVRDFTGWPLLAGMFGTPEDFALADRPQPGRLQRGDRCALLLRASAPRRAEPTWVVLLKPVLLHDASADVRHYGQSRPAFPQEPTADQFFDEAQWESYRSLGHCIGTRVLQPAVWQALARYMACGGGEPDELLTGAPA